MIIVIVNVVVIVNSYLIRCCEVNNNRRETPKYTGLDKKPYQGKGYVEFRLDESNVLRNRLCFTVFQMKINEQNSCIIVKFNATWGY